MVEKTSRHLDNRKHRSYTTSKTR